MQITHTHTHTQNPIQVYYKMGNTTLQAVLTNHTYLGVGINNGLSWANHIQNTTSKANLILGLLRRNLYSCSSEVKARAYKRLVRPHFEYCASVWNPHHKEHKLQLEGVQRRSARFVLNNNTRRGSVTEMLSQLEWGPLEHGRAVQRLTLLYKSVNRITAIDTYS